MDVGKLMKIAGGIQRGTRSRHGAPLRAGPDTELGQLDLDIIRHLQQDGRKSFVDLADALSVSAKTIRKRVAELLSNNQIEITTVTDPRVVGYQSIAMVALRITGDTTRPELAERLFEIEAVDYAVTTFGRYDALVELTCLDDRDLGEAIDKKIRKIPGVKDVDVFPYLDLHYQQPTWDQTQSKKTMPTPSSKPAPLDAIDRQIIQHLSDDGRVTFLDIASSIGASESQVRKRYARLTENNVVRVLAITNPRGLGYETTAWLCINVAPDYGIRDLADRLAGIPSVAYLAICAGRYDLMVEVICRDKEDLLNLINNDVRDLSGIAALETIICEDFFYRRVIPMAVDFLRQPAESLPDHA